MNKLKHFIKFPKMEFIDFCRILDLEKYRHHRNLQFQSMIYAIILTNKFNFILIVLLMKHIWYFNYFFIGNYSFICFPKLLKSRFIHFDLIHLTSIYPSFLELWFEINPLKFQYLNFSPDFQQEIQIYS
jgi:hypothetical protein